MTFQDHPQKTSTVTTRIEGRVRKHSRGGEGGVSRGNSHLYQYVRGDRSHKCYKQLLKCNVLIHEKGLTNATLNRKIFQCFPDSYQEKS